jgi:hypothetical protein
MSPKQYLPSSDDDNDAHYDYNRRGVHFNSVDLPRR